MTVSSKIEIDVSSTEFDKFRKTFDAYKAALESMPATWRGVATQAAGAKTGFEAAANAFAVQAAAAQSITGHVTKLTQTSGVLVRHWHQMHLSTSGVAAHIKDMTTSLQSWAGTLGKLALGGAVVYGDKPELLTTPNTTKCHHSPVDAFALWRPHCGILRQMRRGAGKPRPRSPRCGLLRAAPRA